MVSAVFKNGRHCNFLQFDVVDDEDVSINNYDGLIGLNILNDSEISLIKNYLSLKDNELLIPMNLEMATKKQKRNFRDIVMEKKNNLALKPITPDDSFTPTNINNKEEEKIITNEKEITAITKSTEQPIKNTTKIIPTIQINNKPMENTPEENQTNLQDKYTKIQQNRLKMDEVDPSKLNETPPFEGDKIDTITDPYERFKLLEKIIKIDSINQNHINEIYRIIKHYNQAFFVNGDRIHPTKISTHTILIKDDKPIYQKQFPLKESLKEELNKLLKELLDEGVIEPCTGSLYNHPIFVVKKKENNKYRFVSDMRGLNANIITNPQPVPQIETIIYGMKDMKVFTTIDLKSAYFSIPIAQESKHLTAFTAPGSHYGNRFQYCRLVQGLISSQDAFIEMIETVLKGWIHVICMVYIDDIIIYSENEETGITNLEIVIKLLHDAGIKIEIKKSIFLAKEVEFLGHIINEFGLQPNQTKVELIRNFPIPTGVKKTRQFLGMANFYRRFCPNFAEIAIPLCELTRKNQKFQWNQECQQAFNELKASLAEAPTLCFVDYNRQFIVTCDASKYAVAGVLSQLDSNNQENPISFASRKLTSSESATSSTERELLAVVYSVCYAFKGFLYSRQFVIKTDNKSLVYILAAKNRLDSSPSDRITRFKLKLMDFNFKMLYQPGKSDNHLVADLLSRTNFNNFNSITEHPESEAKILAITRQQIKKKDNEDTDEFDNFTKDINSQLQPNFIKISNKSIDLTDMKNTKIILTPFTQVSYPENLKNTLNDVFKKDNPTVGKTIKKDNTFIIIYKKSSTDKTEEKTVFKIFKSLREALKESNKNIHITFSCDPLIPISSIIQLLGYIFKEENKIITIFKNKATEITDEDEKETIIKNYHRSMDGLHRGIDTTFEKLKKFYNWPNMKEDITRIIKKCHECQINKVGRKKPIPLRLVSSAEECFSKLWCDAIGPFNITENGATNCITFLDDVSRFLIVCPVPDLTAETIAQVFVYEIFLKFGICKYLVSDNAKSFNNQLIEKICKLYNVKHICTTVYHPQSNGSIERVHGSAKEMVKTLLNNNYDNWDTRLLFAAAAYNTSYHSGIQRTPYSVIFGRECRTICSSKSDPPEDNYDDFYSRTRINIKNAETVAKINMEKARESRKKLYDKKTKEFNPKIGDQILIKTHFTKNRKFLPKYKGPYTIININDQYVTILNDANKKQNIHKDEIKIYHEE